MKSQKCDVEAGDGKAPESLPLYDFKPRKSMKYGFTGDEESLFFRDGRRRIDFVLVYQTGTRAQAIEHKRAEKRVAFERALRKEGIDIETSAQGIPGESPEAQLCYAKLHAKWDLLIRYADIMKLRMPLKKEVEEEAYPEDEISRYCPPFFRVDQSVLPPSPHFVSTGFSKSKMALFNIPDRDSFFSPSQRIRIIWECMSRIQFAESNPSGVGIQKLLADDTYLAAFPLHDGPYEAPKGEKKLTNLRAALYDQWGQFSKFYKFQPIEHIKNYFGEKMGFYFAWMEFYTIMLIPAVIVGAICLLYGMITLKDDIHVQEVCTHPDVKDTIMCPICDKRCPYWRLRDSCLQTKGAYLVDNPATIFFAIFMALWASVFLILWKRKQTILSWNFDTYYASEQEEQVRPELEAQIKPDHWKINPITQVKEPYVSPWRRILQSVLSGTIILFMLLLVFAATFGMIVYRIMVSVAIYASAQKAGAESAELNEPEKTFAVKYSTYNVGISGALLNLIVILILNSIYYRIAKWLTEKEYPRTQSEYEDSLTTKYYMFEFVNTYCSVFYIAFFKGRVPASVPGARGVFNLPADRCNEGGCLIELTLQLAVLFLGSNLVNYVTEMIIPSITRALRTRQILGPRLRDKREHRWEHDHAAQPYPAMGLFLENSRMVTQFGFITMFVAAFPLAPAFALISNILEIRLDGYKYLTLYRRPVPTWARGIGAWGKILENVARFSIITNALVISFSSDFVPKLVYLVAYSMDSTLNGYTKWSLSEFSRLDFPFGTEPVIPGRDWSPDELPETCWYREFRTGPERPRPYNLNMTFWHVFAARVILVLVFEHFVMVMSKIITFFVPGIPATLKAKVLRENFLAKETFYEAETSRMQSPTSPGPKRAQAPPMSPIVNLARPEVYA